MFGITPRATTPAPVLPPSPLRAALLRLITDLLNQGVTQLGLPIPSGALVRPLSAFLAARTDPDLVDMLAVGQQVMDQLWAQVPEAERQAARDRVAAG